MKTKVRNQTTASLHLLVRLENSGDLRDQRIVGVWITEERTDREEDLADGESGGPLGPQDVQADGAVGVNVGVINSSSEGHFGRLEGVVGGEVNGQEEHPALVGTVGRSHDGGLHGGDDQVRSGQVRSCCRSYLPVEQVLTHRSS